MDQHSIFIVHLSCWKQLSCDSSGGERLVCGFDVKNLQHRLTEGRSISASMGIECITPTPFKKL